MTSYHSSLIVRRAKQGDEEGIYRSHISALLSAGYDLTAHAYLKPDYYTSFIEAGRLTVAEMANQVVGFGELVGSEIRSLYVSVEHQGKGVGRRLLEQMERSALEQGLSGVNIRCKKGLAESFYFHYGWKPFDDAEHKGAADDDWVDIVKQLR